MTGLSLQGFASPWWLALLAVVGLLGGGYALAQRRRQRSVLRFANFELLDRVVPQGRGRIRHVPAALLGVALVLLVVGLSGPTAEARIPRNRATVMLAMDVSLSMRSTDIEPTRLAAAQAAAKRFADQLPAGINLGLVSFSGAATVLVPPTTDRAEIKQGVDGLTMAEATATGDGINAALTSIESFGKMVGGPQGPPPAHIVLISDGKQTVPSDENAPRGAFTKAREAKQAGIPVSTIAFGTDYGSVDIDGQQVPVPADPAAMQEIARLSGGQYHQATSADQLRSVYDQLRDQVGYETKRTDASKPWVVLGTLAALVAAGWALFLGARLP